MILLTASEMIEITNNLIKFANKSGLVSYSFSYFLGNGNVVYNFRIRNTGKLSITTTIRGSLVSVEFSGNVNQASFKYGQDFSLGLRS